ncbi:hypothetical protein JYU34_020763 [Plutella xylostella]|uniref:Uncharacterized protein n=1 Tax=Plutella xylostella TaxID=51655 RepID=A0ABQ7PRX0_PLUXY|nr:hypothetical protein JYU34_020763 [Plutella xylostella]
MRRSAAVTSSLELQSKSNKHAKFHNSTPPPPPPHREQNITPPRLVVRLPAPA